VRASLSWHRSPLQGNEQAGLGTVGVRGNARREIWVTARRRTRGISGRATGAPQARRQRDREVIRQKSEENATFVESIGLRRILVDAIWISRRHDWRKISVTGRPCRRAVAQKSQITLGIIPDRVKIVRACPQPAVTSAVIIFYSSTLVRMIGIVLNAWLSYARNPYLISLYAGMGFNPTPTCHN